MKKLKLILLACALLGAGTSWAQTDVTATYITNPGFEADEAASSLSSAQNNPTGWTLTSSSGTGNTQWGTANASTTIQGYATSFSPSAGSNYFYLRCNWQNGTTLSLAQTTSEQLTAGLYLISFDAVTYSSNGTQPTYTFKLNDGTSDLVAGTMTANKTSWTNYSYAFTLTSASTVTITAAMKPGAAAGGKHDWMLLDNINLLYFANEEAYNVYLIEQNGLTDATYAAPIVTNFVVNGTFDSNINGWSRAGDYFQNNQRQTGKDAPFSGGFYENWTPKASNMLNKMYQVINNIPNGTYRLDIAAFVNILATPAEGETSQTTQYVFANSDKTYLTAGGPTAYEVYTVVTNNQIEIGLEQTSSTANWMGIDNVSLRYYGAGDVINAAQNAAHKLAWEEALANAEAAIANTDYANVTGKEKSDLQTEIGKAEPSTAQGYDDAAEALISATQAFVNAKASYDLFVTYNADLEYADANKKPTITNETTAATLITALRAYYESNALAEGVENAVNHTDKITNANNPTNNDGWTWTGSKNNPASNEPWTDADGTNTHSYFDGGNWNSGEWTTTMKQTITIPAGKYLLTAKGRAAENVTFTMTVGEATANLPHVGNAGNVFDRGWGDASLVFDSKGKGDEIQVKATSKTIHEWFSISDFRLMQIEDHTLAVANEDLAAAIQAANDAQNEVSELLTIIGSYADPSHGDVLYSEVVRCSEKTALTGALTAANGVDTSDKDAVIAATAALETATTDFLEAVPAYERAEMAVAFATFEKLGLTTMQQYQLVGSLGIKLKNPTTKASDLVDPANTAIQGLVPYFVAAATVRVGFESGEYAPYNNVEGLQALVASETIGTNPADYTNEQIAEQCLILVNYVWTQNTEDVDAIYNGMFATEAEGQNYPDGWTRTNGWGQMQSGISGDFATAYYNQPGSLQYGNQGVYVMPLKADQAYKLTFSYRSHENNSNGGVTVSVLNGKGDGMPATVFSGNGSTSDWKTVEALFTTGDAGNYLLTLANSGNTWMTNVSLVKVESAAIEISENADYTPVETYANVTLTRTIKGDGIWNTFVVPFNLSNEELIAAFGEEVAVAEYSETAEGTNSTVSFNTMGTPAITANKPVLLKGNVGSSYTFTGKLLKTNEAKVEGTANFDFVGTYAASTDIAEGDYFIGSNLLWKSTGATTIKGTRAYIKAKTAGARISRYTIDGVTTGIEGIKAADMENGNVYNLNGQLVEKAQKGLFIINGKKVVVK